MDEKFEEWWAAYRDEHCLKPEARAFAKELWMAGVIAEREACLTIAKDYDNLSAFEFEKAYGCDDVSEAIEKRGLI